MRQLKRYILLAILSLAASGCMNEDDIVPVEKNEEGIRMTFTASLEGNLTKTTLGESDDLGHRKLLWFAKDSIGVLDNDWSQIKKFVNTQEETSEKGIFDGTLNRTYETYYAIYPYRSSFSYDWSKGFVFDIPASQKYQEGSFASDMNPMVAKATQGNEFQFMNLCGILVINLTGDETVTSISLSAKDESGKPAKISGQHTVSMDYVEAPVLTPASTASALITLDCGDGVKLDPTEPTPFYIVLPPATYSSIMVTIGTTDGDIMLKHGTKPLIVTRAAYTVAGTLAYSAEIAIDLSSKGTANCYIVSEPGVYSFDASTAGNGEFGLTLAAGSSAYHTTDATIYPESAELLWADHNGAIGGITYDKNSHRVNFVATGTHGNAVIAVKDAEGKIIWSWHIWATEKPQEHYYSNTNGNFTVLDRNIGAIRANAGASDAENRESIGTVYQWGRKDPFYAIKGENEWDWERFFIMRNTQFTTIESIQMPDSFSHGSGNWNKSGHTNLWSTMSKTIYDPCPVGYRVAVKEIYSGFTATGSDVDRLADINYSGTFDKGFELKYDGTNTAWYPATYYYNAWGNHYYDGTISYTWSSDSNFAFRYSYSDDLVCYMYPGTSWEDYGGAFTVRCMKDDATSSLMVKINDMKEVGTTTATASARISTYGDLEVTQSGFVVGDWDGVTTSTGTVFESNNKTGQIVTTITGLTPLTKYYIRAFATTAEGTQYSDAISFFTPNNEGVVDLSIGGTANCYIVRPAYSTYSFRTVKGNSDESVGEVASVEILWETCNTSDAVTQNSVIASVELDGKKVKFTLPEAAVPGNAVIAVRDAFDTILWSWHIWVADFDPEATKQTYISGAVMMDRNLGALAIADYDPRTHGLYYQWGRKDPFVNPVSGSEFAQRYPAYDYSYVEKITDYSYSIANPTVSIVGTDWNNDNSLWGRSKTIYDPCPAGWKVPDGGSGAWSGIDGWYYGSWGSWGALTRIDEPYSVPDAYYSTGGYIDEYNNIQEYESVSYCYSSTLTPTGEYGYSIRISDYFEINQSTYIQHKLPVRCMEETYMEGGSNEGYGESEDYEW